MYKINDNWFYINDEDNKNRYCLGELGKKLLVVFGINPSIAEPGKLDPTLRKLRKESLNLGYDGWIMFNIYPQRSTNPKEIDAKVNTMAHRKNLKHIEDVIKKFEIIEVVAAWGNIIEDRGFLTKCLEDIYNLTMKYNIEWKCFKVNQTGHPSHPLYQKINGIQQFNIKKQYNFFVSSKRLFSRHEKIQIMSNTIE